MKNKNVQIVLIVILLLAFGIGGYFLFAGKEKPKQTPDTSATVVQKLTAKELGLTLEAGTGNKKVRFSIAQSSDIKSVDYELTYDADSTKQEISEGGEATVTRGITGHADISEKSSYQSDWLILGSQSANVVRYDTGVKSVSITLKVTKNDNKVYQVEDKLDFSASE
jgi:hypothetical protein